MKEKNILKQKFSIIFVLFMLASIFSFNSAWAGMSRSAWIAGMRHVLPHAMCKKFESIGPSTQQQKQECPDKITEFINACVKNEKIPRTIKSEAAGGQLGRTLGTCIGNKYVDWMQE